MRDIAVEEVAAATAFALTHPPTAQPAASGA
jgi:hypothetical protein